MVNAQGVACQLVNFRGVLFEAGFHYRAVKDITGESGCKVLSDHHCVR